MSACKCDLRTKLVGDGCSVCNPAMALDIAKDSLALYAAEVDHCWSHMPELRDTEDHYELHEAVSEVVKQRDELRGVIASMADIAYMESSIPK